MEYWQSWRNQRNAKAVILLDTSYQQDDESEEGGNGTLIFTFKGVALGTDTIKIAECSAINGKVCEEETTFIVHVKQ